ncbi:M3 family oligoendopeptidase [Inhella gelatinilytica]|uniref:Oligoendopeptidase F family protein n=1 Tax=Inhella gelatinilytica TaxID=2795030 RepID=A0A931IXW3_9BURK|nr:M3 family oligoendopeptidase [Inhella gelatinilytica]MBH9552023.1 oligoendopeptidase F family protein [Inhella gelatinilytica]
MIAKPRALALSLALALAASVSFTPSALAAPLSEVWDLKPIFASDADWDAARQAVQADLPKLQALKGTLGKNAASLRAGLDRLSQAAQAWEKVQVYAYLQQSTDNRKAEFQQRAGLVGQLGGQYAAAVAWVDPEIQALGAAKVQAFIKAEPGLKKHAERLRNVLRRAPHTLSAESEAAIAALAPIRGATGDVRTLLVNADMRWPEIVVDGKTERVDDTRYGLLRQHPDRAVRKQVFDKFFGALGQYESTFGVTLANTVQDGTVMARLRKQPSAVGASVGQEEVPEAVYRTLVAEVHKGLPTLHRYFKLRQKMLGLPDLHYYDIYPALVEQKKTYSLDEAARLTFEATQPLGPDYQRLLKAALGANTMHAKPAEGKSGGAYQWGVYGKTPYVFLNHQDDFESVSTFAHEWGHGIHTALVNEGQPYETANYALFVAEIASTANELLLSQHMQRQAKTKEEKLYQLGYALERLRGTFFRQAMFGEFELQTHDAAARGEALNGKRFTELYCKLLKQYHGDAEGVMKIDPAYCQEWAFIPHFYRPFYVYQYATSITAALHFAERVQADPSGASAKVFLDTLRLGSSVPPYEALKRAGLDMASPAPYQTLVAKMNSIMDEMEVLLAAK